LTQSRYTTFVDPHRILASFLNSKSPNIQIATPAKFGWVLPWIILTLHQSDMLLWVENRGDNYMIRLSIILVATVSAVAFTQFAVAADIPVKASVYKAAAAPSYHWTGLYIGGHAGYGWAVDKHTAVTANPSFPAGFSFNTANTDGAIWGGQIGFNYQVSQWVLGIEGEYSRTNITGDTTTFSPLVAGVRTVNYSKIDWIATVTGRIGYTWNNLLGYVKGGAVWTQGTGGSDLSDATGAIITGHPENTSRRDGWIIGIGLEYGFLNNWSAKIEYNYLDFGTVTQTKRDKVYNLNEIRDHNNTAQLVKLGLNYRFSFGFPR
jgi:outer membrane immunogenic protein